MLLWAIFFGTNLDPADAAPNQAASKPNIVFILADDLGYAEVGCYGQTKIRTPNIDRLAAEGMRFTQAYSGSPVCAPSRCTLLTGKHTGHAFIRGNKEVTRSNPEGEGQLPLPAGTVTVATLLKQRGYATACVGKWGLGGPQTSGHPNQQGFDFFFGHLCQRMAHNHYSTHLWRNGEKFPLNNPAFAAHQKFPINADPRDPQAFANYAGKEFAQDVMVREALAWMRAHREQPFFLYVAFPIPHAALQVPEDSLAEYRDQFGDTPYLGGKGYLPHRQPRAAYAAMITRMDRYVGELMALLKELGLDERTLVFFSSDNGPTFNGGTDSAFFESAGRFRGLKMDVYEGGIRVPFIARWSGRVKAGSVSEQPVIFYDLLPTLAEVAGTRPPRGSDGLSILPTLLGKRGQKQHDFFIWEYPEKGGQIAVRQRDWKAVRQKMLTKNPGAIELYDLARDPEEKHDLAAAHLEIVRRLSRIMEREHSPSPDFPWPGDPPAGRRKNRR
jgi:arylsulfatase A-like enzyme